jgi:hypothetical protein
MSSPGQASQHNSDHGEADEGGGGACVSLEAARQAAIAADPCQRSLNDPPLRQDDESVQFVALLRLTISTIQLPVLAAACATRGP